MRLQELFEYDEKFSRRPIREPSPEEIEAAADEASFVTDPMSWPKREKEEDILLRPKRDHQMGGHQRIYDAIDRLIDVLGDLDSLPAARPEQVKRLHKLLSLIDQKMAITTV